MPQTHPPYPREYRRRIIELARAGRSVNELAREFEPSASATPGQPIYCASLWKTLRLGGRAAIDGFRG
jgi:hypothetical protein